MATCIKNDADRNTEEMMHNAYVPHCEGIKNGGHITTRYVNCTIVSCLVILDNTLNQYIRCLKKTKHA